MSHFEKQSHFYSLYRPDYPPEMISFLAALPASHETAVDLACGSGQVSVPLSRYFRRVIALDSSSGQLADAKRHAGVTYRLAVAERLSMVPSACCDFLSIGQALHWFAVPRAFREMKRILKKDGIIAAWGYGLNTIEPDIDIAVNDFYANTVGPYWPPERGYLERHYRDLPFPFRKIPHPPYVMKKWWNRRHFFGYLRSWSAVQRYIDRVAKDPLPGLEQKLAPLWPEQERKLISWPVFLKIGY